MNIGIVSPFNPDSVSDLLYEKDASKAIKLNNGSTSITSIVRGLVEIGHNVTVFTLSEKTYLTRGITWLHGTNLNVGIVNHYKPIRGFARFGRLTYGRVINKEIEKVIDDLDVLHAHWTYEYADACLPFKERLPVFCTTDDWQPYIRTVYNNNFSQWLQWTVISGIVFRKVMKAYPKLHLIPNSPYTKQCLEGYFKGEHFDVIPNSIPHEVILQDRSQYPKDTIILSICQALIDPRKNISSLIKAFNIFHKQHRNAQLWLVGGYEENDETINTWKANSWMDGVKLLGVVQHKEISHLLDNVTLLVHPSLEETFGGVLIEAMARRVPVIGGKESGAVPFVLEHGEIGELCDILDPQSICDSMKHIVDSADYRTALISKATNTLLSKYSNIANAHMQVKMYEKFLEQK